MRILYLFFLIVVFNSCVNNKHDTLALVEDIPISIEEVDSYIKQEIYDEQYNIYYLRKYALDLIISKKLIELEASTKAISSDSLMKEVVEYYKNIYPIDSFIKDHNLENKIPIRSKDYKLIESNTAEGEKHIYQSYKNYIYKIYIDSLNKIYKTKIILSPPKRPLINISKYKGLMYKGNIKSNIEFIIVSDYECSICKKNYKLMDYFYNKYKNKVKFGYINYCSYNSVSNLAIKSAAKQDKFWEMRELIINNLNFCNNDNAFNYANNIGLNINKFKNDFYSNEINTEIEEDYKYLRSKGIDATPTILINGILINNSLSKEEIEKVLIETINNN